MKKNSINIHISGIGQKCRRLDIFVYSPVRGVIAMPAFASPRAFFI